MSFPTAAFFVAPKHMSARVRAGTRVQGRRDARSDSSAEVFMCFLRSFLVSMTLVVVTLAATLFAKPAAATVMLAASGSTSGANPVPIAAQAQLALSGTTLSVVLSNVSPGSSSSADQMLSSFYFDIVRNGIRPTLTYESSSGFVWQLISNAPDEPYNYTPPAVAGGPGTYTLATGTVAHVPSDLKAVKDNDRTWQFRSMNDASAPFLGFGIGTVANATFGGGGGNGFTESIVGPSGPEFIAFSIYKNGDIQPVGAPVQNQFLVLNSATFTFSSAALADYTEADISPRAVFGFGTGPDTVLVVPEPGSLALLAAAGLVGGCTCLRRRRRRRPATVVLAAAAMTLLLTSSPVVAVPIVLIDNEYDFSKGPEGWNATNVAYNNKPPVNSTWAWQPGIWRVEPITVLSELNWVGNYLTSPVIEVAEVVDVLEFNMIHRFNFPTNITTGDPITAGQLAYRIFNAQNPTAPFQPFLPGSFASGLVPPPFDERTPLPNWDVPSFIAPSGLPPLIADGLTWTGQSAGFSDNAFVASRATLRNLVPGDLVEFRLINANLGRDCDDGIWDVSYVRVNGLFLPEPDGLMLAAAGGGLTGVAGLARHLRRRSHQRASNPNVNPLTNTLPPVSVA